MGLVALMHVDLPRVSEVTQSCPTPCDPMDTRLLRPWDFLGKSTGVGCHFLLQGIFPTQGSNPGLPHCRQMLYCLSHQDLPRPGIKHCTGSPVLTHSTTKKVLNNFRYHFFRYHFYFDKCRDRAGKCLLGELQHIKLVYC